VSPGRRSRDDGFPRSLGRSPQRPLERRTCRSLLEDTGLTGKRPARPLRSFAPPGSPFRDDLVPWPGKSRPSVLSWDSYPPESSPPRFGVLSFTPAHAGGTSPRATYTVGCPAVTVANRNPDSDAWIREPRIRRCTESIELSTSQSSGDPAHARLMNARAPATSPAVLLAEVCDEASCPCPLSAAPHASLPFTSLTPEGLETLDLEGAPSNRRPAPTLADRGGDRTPCGARSRLPLPGRRSSDWLAASRRLEPLLARATCGGPPCYQVGQLSWAFVPRRNDSKV